MNDLPLVSIVTPSLNQGKFIEATIQSVLSQDYPNLEYIVMDGGSEDETLTILRTFGDRIRWVSEPDSGQAQAVNKGWRQAQGEILGWINADDLLAHDAVRRAVQALQQKQNIAAVYGNCQFIDSAGGKIGLYRTASFEYTSLFLGGEDYIPQPSVFIRRTAAEYVGFLNESFHFVMDYDFWLRLGMFFSFEYVSEIWASLRIHENAKTGRSLVRFAKELIDMYQQLFEHPHLPNSVGRKKNQAMGNAYLYAASYCFWAGETQMALHHLGSSWNYNPFPLRRTFWLLSAFSLLGKSGWRLAEFLHGNPFRLETPIWK